MNEFDAESPGEQPEPGQRSAEAPRDGGVAGTSGPGVAEVTQMSCPHTSVMQSTTSVLPKPGGIHSDAEFHEFQTVYFFMILCSWNWNPLHNS